MKSILAVVILCTLTNCWGYIQEITLYDNLEMTGNNVTLLQHVPDTRIYMARVRSFCIRGFWSAYDEVEYGGLTINYHGNNGSLYCVKNTQEDYRSFRFGGASETTVEGISIYPEPAYHGEEVYIEAEVTTQLHGKSALFSGGGRWTFYEGQELTGRRCCVATSSAYEDLGVDGEFNVGSALKLDQIGSLTKGCLEKDMPTGRSYTQCFDE